MKFESDEVVSCMKVQSLIWPMILNGAQENTVVCITLTMLHEQRAKVDTDLWPCHPNEPDNAKHSISAHPLDMVCISAKFDEKAHKG